MRTCGRSACIAVMLISLMGMAAAADIRVLSVDAVQNAVRSLAADFAKDTGHQVIFTVGSPADVTQKIKDGEIFDAVIVSEPAMDVLDKDGIVNPESRMRLAKAWRRDDLRGRPDDRRRGAAGRARLHPVPGRAGGARQVACRQARAAGR